MKRQIIIISAVLLAGLFVAGYSGNKKISIDRKCSQRLTQVNLLMHFDYNKHMLLKELTDPVGEFKPCAGYFAIRIPKELR